MTTPQELAYWLQGYFEITDAKVLTTDQVSKIRAKVESCFEKVTPKRGYASDFSKAINNPDLATKAPAQCTTQIFDTFRDRPFANPFEGAPDCAFSTIPQSC